MSEFNFFQLFLLLLDFSFLSLSIVHAIYLFVYYSIYLCVNLSIIILSICQTAYLLFGLCLIKSLYHATPISYFIIIYQSVYLLFYISMCQSIHLHIYINICFCQSIYQSIIYHSKTHGSVFVLLT